MDIGRILKHLILPPWTVRRAFAASGMAAIEAAIRETEKSHLGEIRFAVESVLDFGSLLRGQLARQRAIEVFSHLKLWDTEQNSGVLIYLLLADRDVEIVADRGICRRVAREEWEAVCREMETAFRGGRFEEGVIGGVRRVGAILAKHFPAAGPNPDELPDQPAVL